MPPNRTQPSRIQTSRIPTSRIEPSRIEHPLIRASDRAPVPSGAATQSGRRAPSPRSKACLVAAWLLGGPWLAPQAWAAGPVVQPAVETPKVSAAPPGAGPVADAASGIVDMTLSNGLRLLIKPDRRAPTAIQMVWYRVGSMDEVNGRTGVAHALEHMMFKGTPSHPTGQFSQIVAKMGGNENASTTRDYTDYFQRVPSSGLDEVMALESDRMANLELTQDEFAKEIRVVREERRWRTDDRAQGLLFEQLMAAAYVASPVRTPTVGWMDDLMSMTVDDVRQWYRDWYMPNNAVVVIVGDVDPGQVIKQAELTYGTIPARTLPVRRPQREPEQLGLRRIDVKAPAENPSVLLAFKVPKLVDVDKDVDPYALELLSAVLDADANGRLTRNVVRGSRVANEADAGYDMTSRGPVLFLLAGTPADGKTTQDVERALRGEIERIARDGVRDDELRRVKNQYVASRIYQRDSAMSQASEMAASVIDGFAPDVTDKLLAHIRTITGAQIQAVAARYFGDDGLTIATLLPQPIDPNKPAAARPSGVRD